MTPKLRSAAVVALTSVLLIVGLVNPPAAQAGSDFAIDVEIAGSEAVVRLNEAHKPLGAVELVINGAGPVTGECEFTSGFGSCSNNAAGDGILIAMASSGSGWSEPVVLARVPLGSTPDPQQVSLDLGIAADIDANEIEGTVGLTAASGAAGWLWPLLIVGLIGAALAGLVTLRRPKRQSVTET